MSMFHELMMRKKEQIMYATIKGTLTENDGVFSGFSVGSCLLTQQEIGNKPFELVAKINLTTLSALSPIFVGNGNPSLTFHIESSKLKMQIGNGTSWVSTLLAGVTTISANTDYYVKLVFDGIKFIGYLSSDGTNWNKELEWVNTISVLPTYYLKIGNDRSSSTYYLRGSIDLPNSYIKLGSTKYNLQAVVGYTVVGSPTITDGVLINPTSANYLKIDKYLSADRIEVSIPFSFDTLNWNDIFLGKRSQQQNVLLEITSGGVMRIYFNQGIPGYFDTLRLEINTNYRIVTTFTYDNFAYKIINEDSNIIVKEDLKERTTKAIPYLDVPCFGRNATNSKIAIKDTIIKAGNKLWFNGQEA